MVTTYSVIVPTYKECGNLSALTQRLFTALQDQGFQKGTVELLIVDDNSRDGSVEMVERLRKEGHNIRIDVRTIKRGLSSAVVDGLTKSAGEYKVVMDADLQHPPETVPLLFRALEEKDVEFVLGTRYAEGVVVDKSWAPHRRLISSAARLMARPLTPMSDPMSGFFGIRGATLRRGVQAVSPIGYKIALELFVKCRVQKFKEVGFNFSVRTVGESKLSGKVMLSYLRHLWSLYYFVVGPILFVLLGLPVLLSLYVAYMVHLYYY